MKPKAVFLTVLVFMIWTGASAQRVNRTDICQSIPGLSTDQQQKIDQLGSEHQKKMDVLRTQFQSESDMQEAAKLKARMNSEMQSHYNNISALLTSDQKIWYNQACNAGVYGRAAYGRGQGPVRGLGRGQAYGRGAACARNTAYGRSVASAGGPGYGRGSGYRASRGR